MVEDSDQFELAGLDWVPAQDEKPRSLDSVSKEYGIVAPHQKPEDLKGQTFTIRALRRVESDLGGIGYYYFVLAEDPKSGEGFTTVLGGQAVVQVLDRLIEKGVRGPVTVLLDFVEQGRYDGYYVLR